jgi:hypothetical protein
LDTVKVKNLMIFGTELPNTKPAHSTTTSGQPIFLQECEAKIASLEHLVGREALEIEFLEGALSATASVIAGPVTSLSPKDADMCRARATYYDAPSRQPMTP